MLKAFFLQKEDHIGFKRQDILHRENAYLKNSTDTKDSKFQNYWIIR